MSRLSMGKMMRKRSRRMFQKNVLILFCFMLLFSPFSTAFGDIVENDATEEAREITNLAELNEIRNHLDGDYGLGADIDLSEIKDWEAIGSEEKPFNGVFEEEAVVVDEEIIETVEDATDEAKKGDDPASEDEEKGDDEEREIVAAPFGINLFANAADYRWDDNGDGTVTIDSYEGTDTDITIPSTLSGMRVTTIGYSAFENKGLTSVIIPNSVTTIEGSAFESNNLTGVTIPSSVTDIGENVFAGNPLQSVIVDTANGHFKDIDQKGIYTIDGLSLVQGTTSGTIAEGTKTILGYAFSKMGLTGEIIIPDSVTIIESGAFSTNELTNIILSNNITEISSYMLRDNQLTTLFIPENVISIGSEALHGNDFEELIILSKTLELNNSLIGGVVFWGHEGSKVQQFAIDNGYTFNPEGTVVTKHVEKNSDSLVADVESKQLLRDSENDFSQNMYQTSPTDINGYELIQTIGEETGPYTLEEQTVTYVYKKDESDKEISARYYNWVPLKTGYYEQAVLPLPAKVEVSLNDGSKVELEVVWRMDSDPIYDKDTVGGYLFSGDFKLIDGITNPHGYLAQRLFVLTDAVVTVAYTDVDGYELAPDETLTGKVNDEYTTEAKEIDGYRLTEVPANASGKFLVRDLTVTYVYSKDSEVTRDKEITGSFSKGTMFDVREKELTDIHLLLPDKVTVELDDGSERELNVAKWNVDSVPAYDKDTAGMYTFSGDIELTNGIANSAGIQAKFSVSLNDVSGPDPGETDKKIIAPYYDGVPLKVGIYDQADLPLPKKVKVQLDDGNNVELEVDWHAKSNPVYDKDTAGGYLFSGDFKLIDGIVNPQGFQAYRYFTLSDDDKPVPEPSVVIVTHVDEDGKELVPGKTLTGAEGGAYKTEAEEIEGYTFIKVSGNESGTFTNATIFVEYVYGKDSDLIDTDKDKEIVNVPVIGTTVDVGAEDLADIISRFPSTVEVTLDDGTVIEVGVKWNEVSNPAYDKGKVGAYIFSGEFILPEGIANTASHIMIYQVNVFDYDAIEPIDPKEPIDKETDDSDEVTIETYDEVDVVVTTDDDLTKLPKTATPYYTILLGGLLLVIVGGAIYFIARKKRIV